MRVQLVEPDEELELEPLPPVFARSNNNNKQSSSKTNKDKDKPKRNRKRTWLDALVENVAVQITAMHLCIQPRARVPANGAGEPVLPSPLAVFVDKFAFSLADEHFRAVSHKDVAKLLARSKSNRILTLRKLLTVESVRIGVPRADPNALDALKLPAVRVEVEMKRHTSTGIVFALVASASIGTLSASFERAEYCQFMSSLEGLLWSMRRQTEDQADAVAAEASAKPTRHISRPHHSGGVGGPAAGDDESPAELLQRLDNIALSDDEDEDAANGGEAAASRRDSGKTSSLPLEAGGELAAVSVSLKVSGLELTLTDSPNRRGYTLAMRALALQLSSTVARAADNLNSERNIAVDFSIAAFQSHDLRGISLIAQQQPSRRDGLGDVSYEYEFADGASDDFEGSDDVLEGEADDDDPDAVFRRHSHASSASSLGSMPRRHSEIEVPKPDLVSAKLSVTFIDGAPFSAPMSIELSLRTSPLRFFLERGLLMHLFDFVLSALPALPPTKATVITDFAMLRPERLLIAVHVGVFTIYVPAPIGAPLTHDVRAVIGPIRLRSPTVPSDSLNIRGFIEAGVFLVPVPPNGRAESDSIRPPPHQASMFARDGELPIVHPTVFDIAIEVRNFVRTIEMLVNAAPATLSIMPATQLVEVSVKAGLAIDLSDAALASLVQGWMPVLKILDDSKEIRNRMVLRQRRRAERVKRLLAEHTEDVQRRTGKDQNGDTPKKKKKKDKDKDKDAVPAAPAAPVSAVVAPSPAPAPIEHQKKRAATDGVPPALVSLANSRVAWRLRVRLVPQAHRDEAPILLVRGRDGLPLSLLDIFEDWPLEKWAQTPSPTTLLSLRPAAIHFDIQHTTLGALGARVHLEQLRLDLNQPLMVCPLSIHIVPAVARERGADIAVPASETDAEHAPLPELEELLTGLEIKYDFRVPRKSRDYPHEAHARLLGQHVRICEHGPLGIKPLKNMVKQFYWRTIRGLEMAPKPIEITTFPIWMHVDAQLSDCSMELMRNAQLKEVISRDIFQLSVHPADRKLLVQRTEALERRTRRALAQVGLADKRAADAAADALEANITLAAVKMQLFEMQAEYEAEKKRAYDAVKAAEAAQSEASAVAGTYREVMSLLNTEQGETDTAVTVQRLANEKIMLRNELEACESERAHLERQVEQLQEQIARLTGNTVLTVPVVQKSARSPSPSPKTPKRSASTASHVSASSMPAAVNMRTSADDSSGESDSVASAVTTVGTTPTRGSLLSRVRSKLANSLPVVELPHRGSPTAAASTPGVRGGKDVFLAAPITVHVGEEISVTFAFGSFESNKYDWFGLYNRVETDPKRYVSFQWKRGAAGRASFKAPVQTGVYEIRCFRGKSRKQYYSAIAISNFVNVLHAPAAAATAEHTK
jgi:hypothetical protein